jgi:hypothetical protein
MVNPNDVAVRVRTPGSNPLLGIVRDDGHGYLSDRLRPILCLGETLIIRAATDEDFEEENERNLSNFDFELPEGMKIDAE